MATGAEPSQAPRPFGLLDRPLSLLNPAIDPKLAGIIARCLDPDPAVRFPTMAAVDSALAVADTDAEIISCPYGGESVLSLEGEEQVRRRCRDLARRLGDTLCAVAERSPNVPGITWVSRHPLTADVRARDLNTGTAGTLLALAELVAEFGDSAHSGDPSGGCPLSTKCASSRRRAPPRALCWGSRRRGCALACQSGLGRRRASRVCGGAGTLDCHDAVRLTGPVQRNGRAAALPPPALGRDSGARAPGARGRCGRGAARDRRGCRERRTAPGGSRPATAASAARRTLVMPTERPASPTRSSTSSTSSGMGGS